MQSQKEYYITLMTSNEIFEKKVGRLTVLIATAFIPQLMRLPLFRGKESGISCSL